MGFNPFLLGSLEKKRDAQRMPYNNRSRNWSHIPSSKEMQHHQKLARKRQGRHLRRDMIALTPQLGLLVSIIVRIFLLL